MGIGCHYCRDYWGYADLWLVSVSVVVKATNFGLPKDIVSNCTFGQLH